MLKLCSPKEVETFDGFGDAHAFGDLGDGVLSEAVGDLTGLAH